jgi:hypothetical protein
MLKDTNLKKREDSRILKTGWKYLELIYLASDMDKWRVVVNKLMNFFLVLWHDNPPVGQGLLVHEVTRSHTKTHHSR